MAILSSSLASSCNFEKESISAHESVSVIQQGNADCNISLDDIVIILDVLDTVVTSEALAANAKELNTLAYLLLHALEDETAYLAFLAMLSAHPQELILLESISGTYEEIGNKFLNRYQSNSPFLLAIDALFKNQWGDGELFLDCVFALMRNVDGYMAEATVAAWATFLENNPDFLAAHISRIFSNSAPELSFLSDEMSGAERKSLIKHFQSQPASRQAHLVLQWLKCKD